MNDIEFVGKVQIIENGKVIFEEHFVQEDSVVMIIDLKKFDDKKDIGFERAANKAMNITLLATVLGSPALKYLLFSQEKNYDPLKIVFNMNKYIVLSETKTLFVKTIGTINNYSNMQDIMSNVGTSILIKEAVFKRKFTLIMQRALEDISRNDRYTIEDQWRTDTTYNYSNAVIKWPVIKNQKIKKYFRDLRREMLR